MRALSGFLLAALLACSKHPGETDAATSVAPPTEPTDAPAPPASTMETPAPAPMPSGAEEPEPTPSMTAPPASTSAAPSMPPAPEPGNAGGGASSNAGSNDPGVAGSSGSGGSDLGTPVPSGGMTSTGGAPSGTGVPYRGPFMLGADISSVQEAVDEGATYVDTDGQTKSIFELLAAHGFNAIRLRTFVEPGAEFGYSSCAGGTPYCDTAHNAEFGRQAKDAGMTLLLDFHYSDTWADPGKQVIPEAWRGVSSIAELADLVRNYTTEAVQAMVDAGARPDIVQVGNEITPGMLIHVPTANTDCWGNNSQVNPGGVTGVASNDNWDNLAELLRAGVEGAKAVDPSISIMLHVENTDDVDGVLWWVDSARSRGVEFDVLGLSCYTAFQGQPSTWQNTFETVAEAHPDLQFVIAEYNPERTQANLMMRDLPDGRGVGTFFWEPTQSGTWGESMFTQQGQSYRANANDFAEYDALRAELGL